jgi:hypothetical protein
MIMSYSETLKTSDDGKYRVRLIADEYAPEPDQDGQSPLLQLDYAGGGIWRAEHKMATGRPTDDDGRIEEAAQRWGSDVRLLEKYLRANYGTREIETWYSGSYWYVTYDTARWRGYLCFPPGTETPHPLVNMNEYKAWCEGDCWDWAVERNVTWHRDDDPDATMATWEIVKDSSGYYGRDYAERCALEAFEAVCREAGAS